MAASDGGGDTPMDRVATETAQRHPRTPTQAATADGDGTAQTQAASDGVGVVPDGARVSPVAARAAAAEGVDLTQVSGSGPGGRIVKADVLGAVRQRSK